MSKAITLQPSDVPAHLRTGYDGDKLQAHLMTFVAIPLPQVTGDVPVRELYSLVRITDGYAVELADLTIPPWSISRHDRTLDVEPGFALVCRTWYGEVDGGLTYYLHSGDVVLPAPDPTAALTEAERLALGFTAFDDDQYQVEMEAQGFGRAVADEARASLLERGLVTQAGAVTPKGHAARRQGPPEFPAQPEAPPLP